MNVSDLHRPTRAMRQQIKKFARLGARNDRLAHHLGISTEALERHYGAELAHGRAAGAGPIIISTDSPARVKRSAIIWVGARKAEAQPGGAAPSAKLGPDNPGVAARRAELIEGIQSHLEVLSTREGGAGQGGLALSTTELGQVWARMPIPELAAVHWQTGWRSKRKAYQAPPDGEWTVWGLIAGRGAGKTRAAAETLAAWAWEQPKTRWLVSGRTTADMRSICFEGESGLLAVIPPELVASWNKSLFELTLTNGSLIKGISAEEPQAFRGPQFHGGWLDELAAWNDPDGAWDMIMFGMRLGARPRIIVSTTPKPLEIIRNLVDDKLAFRTVISRGSTHDNLDNLAPTFRQQILQYEGTQLGRQEIHAEILDQEENGIIQRSWWNIWDKRLPIPVFEHVVMSLDTAFTEATRDRKKNETDYTACSVWGFFRREGRPGIMLLDAWQERLGMPELIKRTKLEMTARYGAEEQRPVFRHPSAPKVEPGREVDQIIIEDKGSGISLRQMLINEGIPAVAYNPGKASKLERLHAVSPLFNARMVHVEGSTKKPTEPQDWALPLIGQVCSFSGEGSLKHDDYVDSATQALRYLMHHARLQVTVKAAPDDVEPTPSKPRINPYAN